MTREFNLFSYHKHNNLVRFLRIEFAFLNVYKIYVLWIN